MKTFKSLAIAVSSLCVLPTVAHAKNVSANEAGMAMMRLNASALSEEPQFNTASNHHHNRIGNKVHSGSVWNHLRNDFRMAEVNPNLVRSHEYKFATNSAYFNRTLDRSRPYMYHIVQEVKKRGMPAEIALLPFIESAYVTKAKSNVGASGLWQFMPATGRHYGLEQTPLYDGRHDVYASTDAALNYLQYLHGLFNDWSLALAAYNWGEGNVTRAIRRAQASGIAPTYENLKMPDETRNYVPKLLAVRNLVRNPQAFGLSLPDIQNAPYFKAVTINNPVDIMAAAHLANISESEFLALNPAFKTPVFIPKNGRKMLLPVAAADTFESNYRNNDAKSLLSWDVFTPSYSMSLTEVAAQTGTDLNELRRLNGLNGNRVSAGRSLLVSKNGKNNNALAMNFVSADRDNTPDTFVEQRQPILTNFVAKQTPATTPAANQPATQVATAPKNPVQRNFIVAQAKTPAIDFTAQNKAAAASNPVVINSAEIAKIDNEIQQAALASSQPTNDVASQPAAALPENRSFNQVASEPAAVSAHSQDPLLALANEHARALKEAKEAKAKKEALAVARAKREAERAKAAARIAEAKEAKRKEQELARAERLKQAQELAALRRAREAGEPISVAIREQKKAATATTHMVKEGDTLFNIAQRYNLNVSDLISANNLRGNNIRIGQILKVSTGSKSNGSNANHHQNTTTRNPITKVSGRTSAVMGLSRDVAVSATPSYPMRKGSNTPNRNGNNSKNVKSTGDAKLISS